MVQGFGTVVKRRRRSITISPYYEGMQSNEKNNYRANIVGWNSGMARRLGNYIDNFRTDFTGFVTLTYPASYPCNGVTVKRHWRAFIERLRRTNWFDENSIIWFLEFQERGAPHFHFLCTGWIQKDWVAENWAQITQGDIHACSRVEALRNPEVAGCYARKYAQKSEQKEIPQGFQHVGRMWGCSGNKISKGMPRQPVVVAALKGCLPVDLFHVIETVERLYKLRVAQTLSGMVIYGSVTQIQGAFRWLEENTAITVLTDNFREGSRPPPQEG